MTQPPADPSQRMMAPTRPLHFDVDLFDCEVEGRIPPDLQGTWYAAGASRQFPPLYADDAPFSADGVASMFRIAGGSCDYRARYVRTRRLLAERQARRALFGRYRNPYTSDPTVRDISHGVANTHVVWHGGRLLALKEDSPPVLLDADTLETLDNYHDLDGALTSQTFTAHPKIDGRTGEMLAFGYEARGLLTRDVVVYGFDRHGRKNWETWFELPYLSMLHDMAITPNFILIPTSPMTSSAEHLAAGKVHWGYQKGRRVHVAVLPRGGKSADLRWFEGPERNMAHTLGALERGRRLHLDGVVSDGNPLPFFPALDGSAFDPAAAQLSARRWTMDLDSPAAGFAETVLAATLHSGLPRIDDRFTGPDYRYAYSPEHDPHFGFDPHYRGLIGGPASNVLARFDTVSGAVEKCFVGPDCDLSEPVFAPRSAAAPEGDGYLLCVAFNQGSGCSELVIADAARLSAGVLARVKLPFCAAPQVHGSWLPAADYQR